MVTKTYYLLRLGDSEEMVHLDVKPNVAMREFAGRFAPSRCMSLDQSPCKLRRLHRARVSTALQTLTYMMYARCKPYFRLLHAGSTIPLRMLVEKLGKNGTHERRRWDLRRCPTSGEIHISRIRTTSNTPSKRGERLRKALRQLQCQHAGTLSDLLQVGNECETEETYLTSQGTCRC